MTTENTMIDLDDVAVAAIINGDEDMKSLPLDSEDLKAAVAKKMATKTGGDNATAGDDEDEDEEDESNSDDNKSKGQGKNLNKGYTKRVEKLVAANSAKDKRIQELESKLKDEVEEMAKSVAGEFEYDKPEPEFNDFDTIAEYSKAVTRWEIGRAKAEEEFEADTTELKQQLSEAKSSWEAKQKDARTEFDDFDEIVTIDTVIAAAPSQMAKEFLNDSDIGPQVIYQLLLDSDLTEEFAKATPSKQVRILNKIEGSMESTSDTKTTEKEKTATKKDAKLPTPLPKGRSSLQNVDLIRDADRMSDAEWSKAFEMQRRKT